MNVSYKRDLELESQTTKESISMLTYEFQQMLESNAKAIAEIKALSDEDAKDQIKSIIASSLDDVDPYEVLEWVLWLSAEPYESYLESQSSKWNMSIGKDITHKNKDRYQNDLQEYLDQQKLSTNLWDYHFDLKSISYWVDSASPYSISLNHTNTMQPMVRIRANGQLQTVEKDEVWLEQFSQDVEPMYFKLDTNNIIKDRSEEYKQLMNDDFIPFHHKSCKDGIDWFLNWLGR